MATLTRSVKYFDASNTVHRRHGTYTGPASYATGGDALAAADFGLGTLVALHFTVPISTTPAARTLAWQASSGKVIWFDMAGAEIANGTDLSTFTADVEAIGY